MVALRLLKRDDAHEFKPILAEIESDPGSPLGPLMFWSVVAVFVFAVAWAIFGQVDVVVSARGKVIPAGESKLIQPLTGGLISRILVKEGDFVHKGDPLVIVDPSTTAPLLESSQKTLAHVQAEQARLQAVSGESQRQTMNNATQTRLYEASLASLDKQLNAKEKTLAGIEEQIQGKQIEVVQTQALLKLAQEREARLRPVMDIIAKDDYEKAQNEILTNQNKLKSLSHELGQLRFQQAQTRDEMAYLHNNFQATNLNDLSEKEKQVTQLEASIEEASFKNARQTLTAPVDGYVHELFIHTVGGVVSPAEKVMSIVPVNAPLLIQATVLNKDIGFVKAGMPVAIKIDTFDFQRYGTLQGRVKQVDRDSREDKQLGPVYTVYVTPEQQQLRVDGAWQRIYSGLSVSAEVKTGKRHIIEFFIYPLIKHLDEGMSVR